MGSCYFVHPQYSLRHSLIQTVFGLVGAQTVNDTPVSEFLRHLLHRTILTAWALGKAYPPAQPTASEELAGPR